MNDNMILIKCSICGEFFHTAPELIGDTPISEVEAAAICGECDEREYEAQRHAHEVLYGEEDEPSCDECGSSMEWEDCYNCGGVGGRDGEDLIEEDPLWYDLSDWEDCDTCDGEGGWWICTNRQNHRSQQPRF